MEKYEIPLKQAIVVGSNVCPLQIPLSLVPIINQPLIEYTLEILTISNIDEIYIVYSPSEKGIIEYLNNSRWKDNPRLRYIILEYTSVGDVLREIERKHIIIADFILITGNIVSNLNLNKYYDAHKLKRKDKNYIATFITYKNSSSKNIYVIDPKTNELYYHQMRKKDINIPLEKVKNNVQIKLDLEPCIQICSVEILSLFCQNFDYKHLTDIIHDNLYYKLYIDIINNLYISKVENLYDYNKVSQEVLKRWTELYVPENNFLEGLDYIFYRNAIYKDNALDENCILKSNVAIGKGTTIESNSTITNSVIGKDCKIGRNVKIENCYIWDNTTINNECNLFNTIICNNCTIMNDISNGIVIDNVEIVDKDPFEFKEDSDESGPDFENEFLEEIKETICRSLTEKHTIDNTIVEINTLKFALNMSSNDCFLAILEALLDNIQTNDLVSSIKNIFTKYSELLLKYNSDKTNAIMFIEQYCRTNKTHNCAISPVIQILYFQDVISEELIIKWYDSDNLSVDIKRKMNRFIEWLKEEE